MSRAKSALLGSVSSQLFMVLTMLISIGITPLVLHYLNKEEYGFYTIVMQIVGYITMFDLGLGVAVTRSLAANRGEDEESKLTINKIISTSFFSYAVLGLAVIFIAICLTPFIPSFFAMNSRLGDTAVSIALTLSVFIGMQFPLKVFNSIFFAHQRQLLSNTMAFVFSIIYYALPLLFLHLGYGLWSFVYTNIVSSAIGIATTFVMMRRYYSFLRIRLHFFDKSLLRELLGVGFFLFLNGIAYQVVMFTDRFFIGSLVSLATVTMFFATARAAEFSRELIFKITDSAFPAMAEINKKEGDSKLKTVHQKLLIITACCIAIAGWSVFTFNNWFVQLWLGNDFLLDQSVMVLSLVLMTMHTLIRVSGVCLIGMGTVKGFSLLSLVEAGINLVLTIYLGKKIGVTGILLATITGSLLTGFWYIPYTAMKQLKITLWEYLRPVLSVFLGVSAVGGLLYFLFHHFANGIAITWFNFLFFALVYCALLAAFVWLAFLRKEFSVYVPVPLRKYLLAGQA